MNFDFLILSNILVSAIMMGVIWIVQLVIYPSFRLATSTDFHEHHVKAIGRFVGPVMVLELVLMVLLVLQSQDMLIMVAAGCLVLIWVSTFLIQVPMHQKIGTTMIIASINKLIWSNWIRTIFWTAKTIILLVYGNS